MQKPKLVRSIQSALLVAMLLATAVFVGGGDEVTPQKGTIEYNKEKMSATALEDRTANRTERAGDFLLVEEGFIPPSTAWKFSKFKKEKTYVDILESSNSITALATPDSDSDISVLWTIDLKPTNAGEFPLKCEGNLNRLRSGKGRGSSPPPEFHWAAVVKESPLVEITYAMDWIVPNYPRNRISYTAAGVDSLTLKITDTTGKLVYEAGLTLADGENDHDWDGLTTEGKPVTEAGSPYTVKIVGTKGSDTVADTRPDYSQVKEWTLAEVFDDPIEAGCASGVDLAKVNEDLITMRLQFVENGSGLSWQTLSFEAYEVGLTAVYAVPVEGGADRLFYTTPSSVSYAIAVRVSEDGAMDLVGNECDVDHSVSGIQKSLVREFRISEFGEVTELNYESE